MAEITEKERLERVRFLMDEAGLSEVDAHQAVAMEEGEMDGDVVALEDGDDPEDFE